MISPRVHIAAETARTAALTDEGPAANSVLLARNIHLQFAKPHHTRNEKGSKFKPQQGIKRSVAPVGQLNCTFHHFNCHFASLTEHFAVLIAPFCHSCATLHDNFLQDE